MDGPKVNDELDQLTASQRSMIRKSLRSASAVSDRELERTIQHYKQMFALSNAAVRHIAAGDRPVRKHLPKVSTNRKLAVQQRKPFRPTNATQASKAPASPQPPPLSARQKSAIRRAYREADDRLTDAQIATVLLEKFGPLYGISRTDLDAIIYKVNTARVEEGGRQIMDLEQEASSNDGIPRPIADWIHGLVSERKRSYATDYAIARISGGSEPREPSGTTKNWPEKVRRKIDAMLQLAALLGTADDTRDIDGHLQSIGPGAGSQLALLDEEISLVLLWHSLFHAEPLKLRVLLELDSQRFPRDIADALGRIQAFAFMNIPAIVTPAEAVEELLDSFGPRERFILESRLTADEPATLDAIGQRFGVGRERVRQIESNVKSQLAELLPSHKVVCWLASAVSDAFGAFMPEEFGREALKQLDVDWPSPTASLLLYLAGPYKIRCGWFENEKSGGESKLASIVDAFFESRSTANDSDLVEALVAAGTPRLAASRYLADKAGLRRWDENSWVRWGGNAVEKAHSVLELLGRAATSAEINDLIGESHSVGTIQNGMALDSRFVRTGKRTWGLREWGVEEYSGIVEEIFERIDMRGPMDQQELIDELVTTFSDISVNSIKMYLATPAFSCEGGIVRRRNVNDPWIVKEQLSEVRGAFRKSDSELRLCVPVTSDSLRGSGQSISSAVGAALGVTPGAERIFRSGDSAQLVLRWRPWSTNGPDIGSIRGPLLASNAEKGDAVVLIFSLERHEFKTQLIRSGASAEAYIDGLLGIPAGSPDLAESVARFVGCQPNEVRSVLRSRGDNRLADAIPNKVDTRLENEIANLLAELS
jgi:hypothetical protein